ncbi:tripartite tricarboxylate transporter substrate binding protein [soil metagenome]
MKISLLSAVMAAALASHAALVPAQDFPSQPIRVIVPFPPGASTDVVTRLVAEDMRQTLGQSVLVENRVGATGVIGMSFLTRAPADGYTIGLGNEATHVTVPLLRKQPPYDSLKDFTPLTVAIRTTMAIGINPSVLPVRTLAELIAASKARPQGISFGTAGAGSPQQLIGEMLSQRTGGNFVHVPYTGATPAANDLIAGHIPMMIATLQALLPHRDKVTILAIGDAERSAFLPDVPTISETVPDFVVGGWSGFFGPPNMPPAIAARLNTALVAALHKPAIVEAIKKQSMDAAGTPADELRKTVAGGLTRWAPVIERANIAKQD